VMSGLALLVLQALVHCCDKGKLLIVPSEFAGWLVVPDDADELTTPMMMMCSVTARRRRPVAFHHCRLSAVLAVPDSMKRMVERLNTNNFSV